MNPKISIWTVLIILNVNAMQPCKNDINRTNERKLNEDKTELKQMNLSSQHNGPNATRMNVSV